MKYRFGFLTLLFSIIITLQSLALPPSEDAEENEGGIHIGNGGKVLHCKEDNSYKLLDYYEMSLGNFNRPILGSEYLTTLEKVQIAIDRIKELDPDRHARLTRYLENFYSEAKFIGPGKLGGISDVGLTHIPKDCTLLQAIVQLPITRGLTKIRYTINNGIWFKLDKENRAGLILHEIIYRDFFNGSAHNTSYYVRKFVSLLSSTKLKNYKLKNYIDELKSLYVKNYNYHGAEINLFGDYPIKFYTGGQKIQNAPLITPQTFEVLGKKLKTYSRIRHTFYKNGQLGSLSISANIGESEKLNIFKFAGTSLTVSLRSIIFTHHGKVASVTISKDFFSPAYFFVNGINHPVLTGSYIFFDAAKQIPKRLRIKEDLSKLAISSDTTIELRDGDYKKCKQQSCKSF